MQMHMNSSMRKSTRLLLLCAGIFIFSGCSAVFSGPEPIVLDSESTGITMPTSMVVGDVVAVQDNTIQYIPTDGSESISISPQEDNSTITAVLASAETQTLYWIEEWEAAFFTTVSTIMSASVENPVPEAVHWSRDAFSEVVIAPSGRYLAFVQDEDAFVFHIETGAITRLEEDYIHYAWLPSTASDAVLISASQSTQYVVMDTKGDVVSRVSMGDEAYDAVSFLDDKTAIVAKGLRSKISDTDEEENVQEDEITLIEDQEQNESIESDEQAEEQESEEQELTPAEIIGIPEKKEIEREIPDESELYTIDLLTATFTPIVALGNETDVDETTELADAVNIGDNSTEAEESADQENTVEQTPLRFSYITDIRNMSTPVTQQVLLELSEAAEPEEQDVTVEESVVITSGDQTEQQVSEETDEEIVDRISRIKHVAVYSITDGILTPIAKEHGVVGSIQDLQILLTQTPESGKEMDVVVHTIGTGVNTQLLDNVTTAQVIEF